MSFRDELIAKAIEQWKWFGQDEGHGDKFVDPSGKTTTAKKTGGKPNPRKETVEPYASRIADYWLAIPSKDYDTLVKKFAKAKGKLDGTVDLAWSAAFISYCMQMAGAGAAFPYAPGHATWIVQSIKNKKAKKLKAALVGYEPGEIAVEPGDLVGRSRQDGVTYDNAVATGWFISHTDILVEVDKAKKVAYAIGGNVGQSVSKTKVKIGADGKMSDSKGWMVHIQNNIVNKPSAAGGPPSTDAKVG